MKYAVLAAWLGLATSSCSTPTRNQAVDSRSANAEQQTQQAEWETTHFRLRSGARTNLYHLLLNWAWFEIGQAPPWAPRIAEREAGIDALSPRERAAWNDAVQIFAKVLPGRGVVFDEGLIAVRAHMAGGQPRRSVPKADQVLVEAVESVLPIYEKYWWSKHNEMNVAWIDALLPTLRKAEGMMTRRLAAAYGGEWPKKKVPIDISVQVVPNGAYSTSGRVTMTSLKLGYRMPHALEMVLHEASHLGPLEPKLREAIDRAFEATGQNPPERLWHDLIFYTSGEIARVAYSQIDPARPTYQHYGAETGVYQRGKERWQPMLVVLEHTWKPFVLSGSADAEARQRALVHFATELKAAK